MRLLGRDVHHLSERDELRLGWLIAQSAEHSKSGRTQHWKITAKSRGGVVLWIGNIHDEIDAWRFWHRLQNGALCYQDYVVPQPAYCPSIQEIVGVVYEFATVVSFTTVGTTSWTRPGQVIKTDYLIVGGGGGGGAGSGGAGGAGGFLTGSASINSGSYSVVVGAGAASVGTSGPGLNGGDSSVLGLTAVGGGGGGAGTVRANGNAGGSGGGGGGTTGVGGSGTAGQGNAGGNANTVNSNGGGGGAGAAGGSGTGSVGGNGGNGLSSSITGSAVYYAGGGAGFGSTSGTSGLGGGGNVSASGSANTGGGGGSWSGTGTAGGGGSGIVVLSFTPIFAVGFNMPMMGM